MWRWLCFVFARANNNKKIIALAHSVVEWRSEVVARAREYISSKWVNKDYRKLFKIQAKRVLKIIYDVINLAPTRKIVGK